MDRISPGKSVALVIIDMQERFRGSYEDIDKEWNGPVSVINRMSDRFRELGRPVILLRMEGACAGHPWDGPRTDVFVDELHTADSDIVITKPHMSGFRDTDLAERLRELGCDAIVICGTLTNMCVMNTYFSAYDHDFLPYLLRNGTICNDYEINKAAEKVCSTVTFDHVSEYISG